MLTNFTNHYVCDQLATIRLVHHVKRCIVAGDHDEFTRMAGPGGRVAVIYHAASLHRPVAAMRSDRIASSACLPDPGAEGVSQATQRSSTLAILNHIDIAIDSDELVLIFSEGATLK